MVKAIPGKTVMTKCSIGQGYVNLKEMDCCPWPNKTNSKKIASVHGFHYVEILDLPSTLKFAYTVTQGISVSRKKDGIIIKNLIAGFAFLFSAPEHSWANQFGQFGNGHKINPKNLKVFVLSSLNIKYVL